MRYLTAKQILSFHSVAIGKTGGRHGVRDIESVLGVAGLPKQSAFGQELYEDIFTKSAVYARSIIQNHPFIDGNKRTGIICAGVFLELNGYKLGVAKRKLEDFAVRIAAERLELEAIAAWLKKNSTK